MRRHIFSINSGRSGSEYLARVLDTARNAVAFHEPRPDGAGRAITRLPAARPTVLERALYPPMYVRKLSKVRAVRRTARKLPAGHAYVETNHMFILSFHDVVMNHIRPVEVILLRRFLDATVRSFIELGYFTPTCPFTRFWFTSPNSPSAAVRAPAPDHELDQVDQIIGYLIDVEARAQRFIRNHPDTPIVEIRLAQLNDLNRVHEMFRALGLSPSQATAEVVGSVVNDKPEHKARIAKRVSLDYCRERIERYIARCTAKGIELPALPQMRPVAGAR